MNEDDLYCWVASGYSEPNETSSNMTDPAVAAAPSESRKRRRRRPPRQAIHPTNQPPEWFADDSASIRIEPYYCSSNNNNNSDDHNHHESEGPIRSSGRNPNLCHWLLWERQLGAHFQRRQDYSACRFRPNRILPFTALGTSPTTAILGLDRTGSYLVALTASVNTKAPLRLQLLAVPSPAALQQQQQQQSSAAASAGLVRRTITAAAVPVGTWPLDYPAAVSGTSVPPCPVTTAVRVWLTTRIGICVYRDTTATTRTNDGGVLRERPRLVHAIVFHTRNGPPKTLCHHGSLLSANDDNEKLSITDSTAFWRLYNIPDKTPLLNQDYYCNPSSSLKEDCNLLWHVDFYPAAQSAHHHQQANDVHGTGIWCDSVVVGPAWLFFMDVGDGYRLTWITDTGWHAAELPQSSVERLWTTTTTTETDSPKSQKQSVVRSDHHTTHVLIVAPVTLADSGWEPCTSNSSTSAAPPLHLPCTAFVSVAALLHSILTRRPGLVPRPRQVHSCTSLPRYSYQFVGLSDGGRVAELVIVFVAVEGQRGRTVGICVELDCFTSDYRELEFLRHATSSGGKELRLVCAQLAQRRQRCRHKNSDDDTNENKILRPRLSDDCETFDNRAVRRQTPVRSMKARDAPVELVYG